MELAFIPPNKNLNLSLTGDICLTLANFAKDSEEYVAFYKNVTKYKILDNGAAEGQQVRKPTLLRLAKAMEVQEVVVPDTIYCGWKTTIQFKRFVNRLPEDFFEHYKIMIVPQGQTKNQYLRCLHNMMNYKPEIQKNIVIGLSKYTAPHCFEDRYNCAFKVSTEYPLNPIHLLGATHNIAEIKQYANIKNVRSNDSCVAILLAYNNHVISRLELIERPKTVNDYYDTTLNEEQVETAQHNMQIFLASKV